MVYNGLVLVRKSVRDDADAIHRLIMQNRFREDGTGSLIPVSKSKIEEILYHQELGRFYSATTCDGTLVGCVSVIEYGMDGGYGESNSRLLRRLKGIPKDQLPVHFRSLRQDVQYDSGKIAELRSLVVDEPYRGGIGIALIEVAKHEAVQRGYSLLYSLVNRRASRTFIGAGFRELYEGDIPVYKLLRDCTDCILAENCKEIAVVAELTPKAKSSTLQDFP